METDYVEQMNKLRSGELKELVVKPEDFMRFRDAWTNYPGRKGIVGVAHRGGTIVYHYDSQFA